ncbi:unnamed protein product [Linum tenue]|uniref:Uncharacterized protein n=1 Tax=Linum tenue TaxID=586396 RepID=A0AAV0R0E2_9ROSI|nr:unnamed protein product [Linum tenue]
MALLAPTSVAIPKLLLPLPSSHTKQLGSPVSSSAVFLDHLSGRRPSPNSIRWRRRNRSRIVVVSFTEEKEQVVPVNDTDSQHLGPLSSAIVDEGGGDERGRIVSRGINAAIVLGFGTLAVSRLLTIDHDYWHTLFPFQGWWVVPAKVAFDQTVWAAIWNSIYFVALGFLRFESPANIFRELKATFLPMLTAGWKLWPFAHLITYGVVPVEQRLLWVDSVELIWVTILSTYSNEKSEARISDDAASETESISSGNSSSKESNQS